jgi:hypothetical protein
LQFPYIAKPRPEHADILALNDLVPKTLPHHMRSDICQEMMLAVLEGKTTIEQIEGLRKLNKEDKVELSGIAAASLNNPKK